MYADNLFSTNRDAIDKIREIHKNQIAYSIKPSPADEGLTGFNYCLTPSTYNSMSA